MRDNQDDQADLPTQFYDSWIKRDDAIYLMKNKGNSKNLSEFFRNKLAHDEDIENDEFRMQIHIDFNLEVLRFCLNNQFSAEQISTFISIINFVFRDSLKKKHTTDYSYEKLENIIDQYLYQTPPFSLGIFNEEDKRKMLSFVAHLYKFFQMYEISMTKFIDFNIITHEFFTPLPKTEELDHGHELGSRLSLSRCRGSAARPSAQSLPQGLTRVERPSSRGQPEWN
jgi:hypothetical protein